ncbi:MAG: radical SAM protein [Slackia sp.]
MAEFDAVGITLPHELAATNVLEFLDLSGVALRSVDRKESDPMVFGGGPCFQRGAVRPRFRRDVLGEGEESLPELLELHRRMKNEGATRADMHAMAKLPSLCSFSATFSKRTRHRRQGSWVVPRFDDVPSVIEKRLWEGFAESDAYEPTIVPFTEVVHDRLNVEIARLHARVPLLSGGHDVSPGARAFGRQHRVGGMPVAWRYGYDEVSLTSLSSTDHSQIEQILRRLNRALEGKGISISIPSQRLDSFGVDMAELVAGGKRGGLTFAPEAGTQRLRDVINKGVTEDDLFGAIDAAFAAGWRRCKLYFMIGLPTETDDDIKGIASLAQRAYDRAKKAVPENQRGNVRVSISCALFVPKAQTPFQWDGQISPEEAKRRIDLLRRSVKYRAVDVHWHEPDVSLVEAMMSRGGREVADVVETAWRAGARFDAWTELFSLDGWKAACEACGVSMEGIAQATYDTDYIPPWSHLSAGLFVKFLQRERRFAQRRRPRPTAHMTPVPRAACAWV